MPKLKKFDKTTLEREALSKQKNMDGKAQEFFWHPTLGGFGLKVSKTRAVYVAQKTITVNGQAKTSRTIIGSYREMTVDEALLNATNLMSDMKQGLDPNEKAPKSTELTLEFVLNDYLEKYKTTLRPKTQKDYRYFMRSYLPDWLDKPLTEITEDMIAAKQVELSGYSGPRSKEGGAKETANKTMRVLSRLFSYAMVVYKDAKGKPAVTLNPVTTLKPRRLINKSVSRKSIIENDDLASWYQAVMGEDNATGRDYLLLCLFTGMRRGEAEKLTWDNVNLQGKKPTLTVPASIAKTGVEYQLPLPAFIVDLLDKRVRRIDSKYIFYGDKPNSHIVEPKRVINRVKKASEVYFSMHVLRKTFGTIAGRLDIAHYKHKMLMNHSMRGDVTGAHYVHMTTEDLREPMQKICAHICQHAGITVNEAVKENA